MRDDLNIFICTHKNFIFSEDVHYTPLLCGADFNKDIGTLKDNVGENISPKNKNYSELTGLYWIWKNVNSEYVGLCHYRRYFDFNKKRFKNIKNNTSEIKKLLEDNDIILSKTTNLDISIEINYKKEHIEEDWEELKKVIKEKYPDYNDVVIKVFNENKFYPLNMFVAKKEVINGYCEWLFDILFEVEKRIKISSDPYQARVFGFMSERLMRVYVEKNNLKVKEVKVLFFNDNGENPKTRKYKFMRSVNKRISRLKEIFHV